MPTLLHNAAQVVRVSADGERVQAGPAMRELAIIENGSVLMEDGKIAWVGRERDLPPRLPPNTDVIDVAGKIVLPGLVDSHTHLIFAGTREEEFEQRLQGVSYADIATAGGGINRTVRSTRAAPKDELKNLARRRLQRMLAFGVTTVEIKSGYGLSVADEVKSLEAIAELKGEQPCDLIPTFLRCMKCRRNSSRTAMATYDYLSRK